MPTGLFSKISGLRKGAVCGGACAVLLMVLVAVALQGPSPASAAINPAEILGLLNPNTEAKSVEAQYRKAAIKDDRQAKIDLACYLFRQHTVTTTAEARKLLEQVALQGDIEAMIHLSKFVYTGVGAAASEEQGDELAAVTMAQQAFDALRTGSYSVSAETGGLMLASNQYSARGMDIQGWLWLISPTCGPGRAGTHIGVLIKNDKTDPPAADAIMVDDTITPDDILTDLAHGHTAHEETPTAVQVRMAPRDFEDDEG